MMKWIKKNCRALIIVSVLLFLPFSVNLCSYSVSISDCSAFVEPSAWVSFWANYLSAIASFAMVFVTWRSLKQNSQQLEELKRQWEEDHKPRIYPRIIIYNKAYYLEFFNSGKTDAFNVCININQTFIDNLPEIPKSHIKNWINSSFYVKAGASVYAFVGWCDEISKRWKNLDFDLEIEGSYNSCYKIEFSLPVSQFTKPNMVVRTPTEHALEELAEGLVRPHRNTHLSSSQELLESIDKSLEKIANHITSNGTEQTK